MRRVAMLAILGVTFAACGDDSSSFKETCNSAFAILCSKCWEVGEYPSEDACKSDIRENYCDTEGTRECAHTGAYKPDLGQRCLDSSETLSCSDFIDVDGNWIVPGLCSPLMVCGGD